MRVLVVTLVLSLALPATAQESDVSPERLKKLQAMARKVARKVEQMRGLKFKREVPVGVQTRKALGAFLKEMFAKEMPAEVLARDNALARKMGLIPRDADLGKIFTEVMTENVGGFYLPAKRRLFLVADPVGGQGGAPKMGQMMEKLMMMMLGVTQEELVAVHELVHALDDQHYQILGMQIDKLKDEDRLKALQCAYEGTANVIMYDYLLGKMGQDSRMLAAQDLFGQVMSTGQAPAIDKAPRYVKASLLAPYTIGLRFVSLLKQRGGWELVNKMYTDPPQSMEQVLHVDKYLNRDVPMTVALTGLDAKFAALGYEKVGEQTLGEFLIRELLQDRLGKKGVAARASMGWDGDRYAIYRHKETKQLALALVSVFDSTEDAREFAGAYELLHRTKYPKARKANGVLTDGSGAHAIVQVGPRVHVLESVPASALAGLQAQLGLATLMPLPTGLPKLPLIKREKGAELGTAASGDPTAGLPFSAKIPEGWTGERAEAYADARYPLTLSAKSGGTIKVGVLPGALTPEVVGKRIAQLLPNKLDEYREARRGGQLDMLPAGTVQLNYSGVANAEVGRRRFTQLIFALGGKTYMVILSSAPGRGARAERQALGEFVRSFTARK